MSKPSNPSGFWGSFEIHAVSAGFKYDDYLSYFGGEGITSAPLSEEGYKELNRLFDNEYIRSMNDATTS
mgnify:CR=1 FL=1